LNILEGNGCRRAFQINRNFGAPPSDKKDSKKNYVGRLPLTVSW